MKIDKSSIKSAIIWFLFGIVVLQLIFLFTVGNIASDIHNTNDVIILIILYSLLSVIIACIGKTTYDLVKGINSWQTFNSAVKSAIKWYVVGITLTVIFFGTTVNNDIAGIVILLLVSVFVAYFAKTGYEWGLNAF